MTHVNIDINLKSTVSKEIGGENIILVKTEKTALHLAIQNENLQIVHYLIRQNNIDFNCPITKRESFGYNVWIKREIRGKE